MKLSDIRRLAIRKQLRVRFRPGNGMDCIVDEHGVAKVPSLAAVPAFGIGDELAQATRFALETAARDSGLRARLVKRDELMEMASVVSEGSDPHEHEE